jgi:glycerol-3-phosphate dehydrogenase
MSTFPESNVTRIAAFGSMPIGHARVHGVPRTDRYESECFKIQAEIVVNASGANVSSIARDSAGKPR